jgi:hypothetical protein
VTKRNLINAFIFTLLFLLMSLRVSAQENDYYGQIAAQAEQTASQNVKDRIKKEMASDRAQADQRNNVNTTQPIKPGVQGNQWSQPATWGPAKPVAKPENNNPGYNAPPPPISKPEQQPIKQPEQPEQSVSPPATAAPATGIPSSTSPASPPNIFLPQQSATPNR